MSAEFAGTLKERIAIERPATARTAGGLQTAGWEPVAECLAAIAPEGAGAESEAMSLSAMPRFKVTIRARKGIAVGQRVRWNERLLAVRVLIDDPRLADRLVMRCEEVR